MIWRSAIFSRSGCCAACACLCLAMMLCAATGSGAIVSGRVELTSSQDPNVRKHQDYSGVVVWLEPAGGFPSAPAKAHRAEMIQKGKTFTPHVLPILVGTTV